MKNIKRWHSELFASLSFRFKFFKPKILDYFLLEFFASFTNITWMFESTYHFWSKEKTSGQDHQILKWTQMNYDFLPVKVSKFTHNKSNNKRRKCMRQLCWFNTWLINLTLGKKNPGRIRNANFSLIELSV